MAKIALIVPPFPNSLQQHRSGSGQLGLGYIAACLLRDGHDVLGIDAKFENLTLNALTDRLEEYSPDIVGVTAMTHEIHSAAAVCDAAKHRLGSVLTMVGGPHTTALSKRTLLEFPAIDIAAVGEGEKAACEIASIASARWQNFSVVNGIAFRKDGEVIRTAAREMMTDLDQIPFPAWQVFPRMPWPMMAGRGCPFGCKFCQRVLGRTVRMRSVDNIMEEIDALEEKLGQTSSWFQDETFALNPKWTDEFLTKLERRNATRGYTWQWRANSRVNLANLSLYKRMHAAGCQSLDFGVESGSDRLLRAISKNITKGAALKAIKMAKQAGMVTSAFFIIGHPGETLLTALKTVFFAGRLGSNRICVGVMVPYPGTEIWDMAKKGLYNYKLLTEDWRVYDKYFGNALAIRGLSHRVMEVLQVLAYLWFYIRQGHILGLFKFIKKFKAEAKTMLLRLIFGTMHEA